MSVSNNIPQNESYEQRRDREERENRERYMRVLALVQSIKLEGWTYQAREGEQAFYSTPREYGKLIHAGLRGEIWFSLEWNDKSRLVVHVNFPRDRNGQYYGKDYNQKDPRITVSLTKTAEAIARDIQRRLLPEYLPMLAERVKRIQANESGLDQLSAQGKRFAEAFHCLQIDDRTKEGHYRLSLSTERDVKPAVTVGVHNGTVSIHIDNVEAGAAIQLLGSILPNNEQWKAIAEQKATDQAKTRAELRSLGYNV